MTSLNPATQDDISKEIAEIQALAPGITQPRLDFPPYRSSLLRHPTKALRWGVAAICIGVGQGLAVVLENAGR